MESLWSTWSKDIFKLFDWFIDFHLMSMRLGLIHAYRFRNRVPDTFVFAMFRKLFHKSFLFVHIYMISFFKKDDFGYK